MRSKFFRIILLVYIFHFGNNMCFAEIFSTISGKVLDEATKTGIKGVTVVLTAKNYSNSLLSDAKGEFEFNLVPPGAVIMAFFPPAPYACELLKNENLEFVLEKGKNVFIEKKMHYAGILEISVNDVKTKTPIPGAEVFITAASLEMQSIITDTKTDYLGIYRNARLFPGFYDIIIRKDGLGTKCLKNIEIRSKDITKFFVSFDSGSLTRISGRIYCSQTGNPIDNVEIIVAKSKRYMGSSAYSDREGRFTICDIEPDEYELNLVEIRRMNDDENEYICIKKTTNVVRDKTSIVDFCVDCNSEYSKRDQD
jgi:hypothetical protein